jgi:GDPmannose 4,6-dehydratase
LAVKTALIFGVSGQDGAYLAKLLLDYGYHVVGTSRDAALSGFDNLRALGIRERVQLTSAAPTDFRSVAQVVMAYKPDEIYNLSGQSSVGLSFEQPVEALESIAFGTLNLLEAIRLFGLRTRFYNACSSECFGETKGQPADENTPFYPRSPYGVAKATSHWEVVNYREAYGLYACSGILFNHESPLRPARFVTRKVIAAACRISAGSRERLKLGNLSIRRDWGWAPEYVEAMWRMLQQPAPADYVIATGETNSLESFVAEAFAATGLDWRDHVDRDPALLRPSDIAVSLGNPTRAREHLGWVPKYRMKDVVKLMVGAERESAAAAGK